MALAFRDSTPQFVSIIGPQRARLDARPGNTAWLNGDVHMKTTIHHRCGSGEHFVLPRPASIWVLMLSLALAACGGKEEAAPAAASNANVAAGTSAEVAAGSESTVLPATVPQLLDSAKAAYGENRVVSPAGDNAIDYYLSVLQQDKDNIQATQGLVDLFPLGVSIAEKEIAALNNEEAERIIGLLDESSPNSYTVQKLKSRLAASLAKTQREEERRLAAEQAQLAQQARAQQVTPEPVAATPTPPPAATPRQTRPAEEPEARPAAPVVAAEPAAPVGETRDAKVVRQVQPGYPQLAYRRRLAGWVEIRFTVGTNGKVSNAEVIRSDPARMFDREAVRAVEQWMFEPALRNGEALPSVLSRRIEFKYPG